MATQWIDVVSDPEFSVLPEEEKSTVRDRYFKNVVQADPSFINSTNKKKESIRSTFFGLSQDKSINAPPPVITEPSQRPFIDLTKIVPPRTGEDDIRILEKQRQDIAGLVSPSVESIGRDIARTGKVPLVKTAIRGTAELAADFVPLTGQEFAFFAGAGGVAKGISKVSPLIGRVIANKFPKLHKILNADLLKRFKRSKSPKPPPPETSVLEPSLEPPEGLPARPLVTPEQTQAIAKAQKTADTDIFNQQLKKFNVTEDAQGVFQETSNIFKGRINKARRGKIDFKGTEDLARNLGMTPKDLIKRRKGKAFNAEELESAKGLVSKSLDDIDEIRKVYVQNQNPQNLVRLNAAISRHAAIQESFMGARAEAGRALSILRKSTDPVEVAQQNFDELLKAFGGREMSEEMARRLAMIDPTDIAGMNKFIREVVKAKTTDQIYEVWINGLLSSPVTQMRNFLGNSLFLASKVPEKALKGLVDTAISPFFSGARTRFSGEASKEFFAIGKGLSEGVRRGLHALKTGLPKGRTKLELQRVPSVPGITGQAVRLPSRVLIAGDEFAKGIVNRMETAAQVFRKAKLEGKTGRDFVNRMAELEANPTDDILKAVREEELLRTFQTRGPFIRKLSQLREIGPMKFVVPFLQTPANIAIKGIERSPLGIFTHVLPAIVKKKGQAAISEATGNALLGSGIAATIAYHTLQGKVTGSPPRNPAERDLFFRNKIPYAVKIKDSWYSYSAFEPLALVIGATADSVLKGVEANKAPDQSVAGAITSAIPRFMVSQTFLSGVRDFMDAVSDGERYGDKYINRLAGSAVPFSSFNRWVAQNLDPIIRRPGTTLEAIKTGIPGLSKQVPALITATGEPATRPSFRDGFLTGVLKNMAIPSRRESLSPLDIEDEFLERQTTSPGRTLGGVKLNNREFQKMKALTGRKITGARKDLQKIEGWRNTSQDDRNRVLDALVRMARKEARHQLFPEVLGRVKDKEIKKELKEYGQRVLGIGREE